jgi:hypothetical protein
VWCRVGQHCLRPWAISGQITSAFARTGRDTPFKRVMCRLSCAPPSPLPGPLHIQRLKDHPCINISQVTISKQGLRRPTGPINHPPPRSNTSWLTPLPLRHSLFQDTSRPAGSIKLYKKKTQDDTAWWSCHRWAKSGNWSVVVRSKLLILTLWRHRSRWDQGSYRTKGTRVKAIRVRWKNEQSKRADVLELDRKWSKRKKEWAPIGLGP